MGEVICEDGLKGVVAENISTGTCDGTTMTVIVANAEWGGTARYRSHDETIGSNAKVGGVERFADD